ncbi:MAG: TRAP-type mannitol/chloroaromatic compound transport system permease small subunit [Urechidicola sp.]|jgi:TRAP-type mannitol/chloroaromatic compound transport system permease small subunit
MQYAFNLTTLSRCFAYSMVIALLLYLINNYLVYWQGLPGPFNLMSHYQFAGLEALYQPLDSQQINHGWIQFIAYLATLVLGLFYVLKTANRTLHDEAFRFALLTAYIIRVSFWSVVLVGSVDMLISFLRVEDLLEPLVGEDLTIQLGRPIFRGSYVHYPLILISFFMATIFRQISFSWLALFVVLAEFSIVISRFVFSYEQAYMGDIVRFWYAALFLFASAYTLVEEGHVRVDVVYAGMARRTKALTNTIGCLVLGMPICWVILMHGMGGKGNSINSPLLSFEVSQSGYGMYVKYIMAGFLVVFAMSMLIQFVSYLLYNISELLNPSDEEHVDYRQLVHSKRVA